MNRFFALILSIVSLCLPLVCLADSPIFFDRICNPYDPLAARDEYGLLHQGRVLNRTDFDRRRDFRFPYYFQSGTSLISDPAYVGALQRDLRRLGYYCGEIDGIFSQEVSGAIARMQKNYSMTVTGTLTVPVRRALQLP
jgi:hypothetical protein